MSLTGFIRSCWYSVASYLLARKLALQPLRISLDRSNWKASLQNPTEFYFECLRFFHQKLDPRLKAHRTYFHNVRGNRRGFGEDAFHVEWFLLFREFRPANFLEIGVFRGQTISLAALLANLGGWNCEVTGISPFSSAGDAVSKYRKDIDYYADTLANFDHFKLPHPNLLRAYSTDPKAAQLIASRLWDMIYIDGNHDYEVAKADWDVCSRHVKPGGIIVLDDSGLSTSFQAPPYLATRGHPGPSQLAQEIDRSRFLEILQVGHNRAFQRSA